MTIRLTTKSIPALESLHELLEKSRYDAVQRAARGIQYYMDPWPNFAAFSEILNRLPDDMQTLYRLFLLGQSVSRNKADKVIGTKIIQGLRSAGIVRHSGDDEIQTSNLSLVSYQNRYVLTDLPYYYPTCKRKDTRVYIGMDSYLLGQNLLAESRGDVLDLCTGTGFQAIQAASQTNRILGVELEPEAVAAARCNVVLNGLEDRIEIVHGNLYQAVGNARFDVIYANPPFLPVPEGVRYPLSGDGGYDGLKVLRTIVEGLPEHLKDDGRCALIAEGVGDRESPFLLEDLKKLFKGNKWNILMLIRGEMPLEYQAYVIAKMTSDIFGQYSCEELFSRWCEMYARQGAEKLFSFHLFLERVPRGGRISVIRVSESGNPDDVPVLNSGIEYHPGTPSYFVHRNGKRLGEIDQEAREFLQLCDGKRTISQITAQLYPRYAERYAEGGLHRALFESMATCQTLAAMQVIRNGKGKARKGKKHAKVK